MSGRKLKAWPDLMSATDPELAKCCRSCAPRLRWVDVLVRLKNLSVSRPMYQPSIAVNVMIKSKEDFYQYDCKYKLY